MTNYEKWNKWDVEEELVKVDERESHNKEINNIKNDEKLLIKQLNNLENHTKQVTEAYRSQAAVDALKAKGGMRNRRRKTSQTLCNTDEDNVTDRDVNTSQLTDQEVSFVDINVY